MRTPPSAATTTQKLKKIIKNKNRMTHPSPSMATGPNQSNPSSIPSRSSKTISTGVESKAYPFRKHCLLIGCFFALSATDILVRHARAHSSANCDWPRDSCTRGLSVHCLVCWLLGWRLSDYGRAACVPAKCVVWVKEGVRLISIPQTHTQVTMNGDNLFI